MEERYPMTISDVQLLQHFDDQVFLITTKSGKKYKFKLIHTRTEERKDQLEEIAKWVGFLNENLAVPLPGVHATRAGELTFKLTIGKSSKTGILYHWLDWSILEQYGTESMWKLGQLLGQIHRLTKAYVQPTTHLPTINSRWMLKEVLPRIIQVREPFGLSEPGLELLHRNMTILAQYVEKEESNRCGFGPIHSDIHRNNIIEKDGRLSLIDLDDTVFAPYLLDLGVILNELADHPQSYQDWSQSLLQGYCTEIDEEVVAEDLQRSRSIADLIYADWIASLLREGRAVDQKKLMYGQQALSRIIAM
ncbi:MAG: phosphotransferase [Saprospiraceae bacterium]|nr:phosphotransferase [Saprospiraceae bacterium]